MSWLVLDNHDVPRISHDLPEHWQQKLAQVMQFTLPGSPNLYYGTELGMSGGGDPENRSPMRWDLVKEGNDALNWMLKLVHIHKKNRALRIGEYRSMVSTQLLAYERYTDKIDETIMVFINPHDKAVSEHVMLRNSRIMASSNAINLLDENAPKQRMGPGFLHVTLPARNAAIYKLEPQSKNAYSNYKRIQ